MKTLLLIERIYPYLTAAISTLLIRIFCKIDFFASKNLNDALTAIITVTSIIIGFMGAILPVILSMKNDSKVVQYVFQKDKRKLFLEYIKTALGIGLALIIVSIVSYFKDQFTNTCFYNFWQCVIIFMLVCFLCATYRCLKNILNLIFKTDDDLMLSDEKKPSAQKLAMDRLLAEKQKQGRDL